MLLSKEIIMQGRQVSKITLSFIIVVTTVILHILYANKTIDHYPYLITVMAASTILSIVITSILTHCHKDKISIAFGYAQLLVMCHCLIHIKVSSVVDILFSLLCIYLTVYQMVINDNKDDDDLDE